jgi:hypothetical protein
MKDLNWVLMVDLLSGAKFTNYGLQKMAELNVGEVVSTHTHMLLTQKLYEPTWRDRFTAS